MTWDSLQQLGVTEEHGWEDGEVEMVRDGGQHTARGDVLKGGGVVERVSAEQLQASQWEKQAL